METQVRINKKYEKRETNREASALKAAQVERAIEKELLNRLKVGTFYKDIYNLDKKEFETKLDENEVADQTQYEVDEENENEDLDQSEDDSLLGGDLEIDEAERRMLELAEAEDEDELNQIENIDEKMLGKKRQKPVRIAMEQEIEYELEAEEKQKRQKVKNVIKPKKSNVVDF
jgi:protein MAK16